MNTDNEPFHLSRSSDGTRHWFSARDEATGVSIPAKDRDQAVALVSLLNRAFEHHLKMALAEAPASAEPVAWQRRIRAGYRTHTDDPGPWEECSHLQAKDAFMREPKYEYRPLYTGPKAAS